MFRGSSPIFDVPDFPALRTVKPLPKRRRTTNGFDPISIANNTTTTTANLGLGFSLTMSMGIGIPGPNATAEDLLAHADSLSAQMALQSYYMPILGGVQDLFRDELARHSSGFTLYGAADGREDDGDYIDHLQHPGNTKKRKVPANASASPRGHDTGSGQSGGEDDAVDRAIPTGRGDDSDFADSLHPSSAAVPSGLGQRRGKISPTTLAGLQHKEMLKNRKRQLAAVLGALSHGDTLALDQALSGNYPLIAAGFHDPRSSKPPKVRLSRRPGPRRARQMRHALNTALLRHPDAAPFPKCDFSFVFPSATGESPWWPGMSASDRLVATKEEVAQLRSRFEAELARQATKAAKLAATNKLMSTLPAKSARSKRANRAQRRVRSGGGAGEEPAAESLDQSLLGVTPRGKKKKRSALANASNPHHLKNYVPSRLPHSGHHQTNPALANSRSQNFLGAPPLRFLSAEVPPRRWKKPYVTPLAQVTNPEDEWICAFCEYELFYGDDQEYRRAVRMRKKVLRRRRRARERAAAAAAGGNSTSKVPERGMKQEYDDDEDDEFEPAAGDDGAILMKHNKSKGELNHKDGAFG